ncbi:hypothetical protein pneo_cds_372 [Pandoravirus neocaledonia]|uniref:Uncharacterized protein n=1 Tax=Pandoravirus neocaledonia TaxID=2107708 RepID=A0A2U7UBZ0_9VIRU|nr:hypothetical protein pneo_cds_372 [Pandoravirus neocaledonia]AVK75979.1 hypothetical protein pneo_cds_372 [Pandoravirus neocaledonia]
MNLLNLYLLCVLICCPWPSTGGYSMGAVRPSTGNTSASGGGHVNDIPCCDSGESCCPQVVCCPQWEGSGYACCLVGTTCSATPGICNPASSDDGLTTTQILLIVGGSCVGVIIGAAILVVARRHCAKRAQYDRV